MTKMAKKVDRALKNRKYYEIVRKKLDKERNESKLWLKNAIGIDK